MRRAALLVVVVSVVVASPGLAGAVDDVVGGDSDGPGTPTPTTSHGPAVSSGVGTAGSNDAAIPDGRNGTEIESSGARNESSGTENESDSVENESNGTVAVATGAQLSTVLAATEDSVGTAVSTSVFDSRFRVANGSERAVMVADRAATLRREAGAVLADYRAATRAYRNGTANRSTYAQRLATLESRAESVRTSVAHLRRRAANVSELELAAAGFERTALNEAAADLRSVSGAAPAALLQRFTGRSNGTVTLSTDGGVAIEVESDDGDRARAVRTPGDRDRSVSVGQDDALTAARAALSADRNWTLRTASVRAGDGTYGFEFGFATANATGEAEVRVDGSTGEVVRVEEETETRDPDDERGEDERGNETDRGEDERPVRGELVLLVVDGRPAPGATVTLQARRAGAGVANATVRVDGTPVGETNASGLVDVTLSATGTTVRAVHGDREAEIEFEFESGRGADGARLNVTASLDGGRVTLAVAFAGERVPGAQVAVDGERVGPTGPDGTASFPLGNATGEVELTVLRGHLELERTYRVENGSLVSGDESEDDERGNPDERNGSGEGEGAERENDRPEEDGEPDGNEDERGESDEDERGESDEDESDRGAGRGSGDGTGEPDDERGPDRNRSGDGRPENPDRNGSDDGRPETPGRNGTDEGADGPNGTSEDNPDRNRTGGGPPDDERGPDRNGTSDGESSGGEPGSDGDDERGPPTEGNGASGTGNGNATERGGDDEAGDDESNGDAGEGERGTDDEGEDEDDDGEGDDENRKGDGNRDGGGNRDGNGDGGGNRDGNGDGGGNRDGNDGGNGRRAAQSE